MAFRFKKFEVYKDAKNFSRFCREIVNEQIADRNLADQIKRALNSIVLNIAEGSADNSDIEFARFLSISIRSAYEVVAGFDLANFYGLVDNKMNLEIESRGEMLVKRLSAFRSSLKKQ